MTSLCPTCALPHKVSKLELNALVAELRPKRRAKRRRAKR